MLTETFVTSIRAQPKSANTAISKDIGIYVQNLHPTYSVKAKFKKSSTLPNCLSVSSSHIFAAQAGKAVVHVYSRDRGNQEALISFPEKLHSLTLVGDGLLVLGTAEGRAILWEVCTGRQVSTPTSHLQPICCLAATSQHLLTGSEDSNILVWSIPSLLSLDHQGPHEALRSLSNHRAAITALNMGKSSSSTNICVSGSKDNTCIVWNYHSGELLRTFLLPSTPLCAALDPCDRAIYVGFESSTIQALDLLRTTTIVNSLSDPTLQSTPIQITSEPFSSGPDTLESVNCINLSYDGTTLLSGHESGKIVRWDTGPKRYRGELADLNAPVTNLSVLPPFPDDYSTRAINIVKPKLGEGNHTFTAQFVNALVANEFEDAVQSPSFPSSILDAAVTDFYSSATANSSGDDKLRKENEELWAIVNEQRELQKQTWNKFRKTESGKVQS